MESRPHCCSAKRVKCCNARLPTTNEKSTPDVRGVPERQKNLDDALRLADELLAKKKPTVTSLNLAVEMAEFSSASWQTAERTGALALMDYAEVQKYSRLYSFQELFAERQRRAVDQLALTIGILHADPTEASTRDLELFRERLIELRATQRDRRTDG